jgi:hypothetical protein
MSSTNLKYVLMAGLDPAIQIVPQALDRRVSPLRGGPAMRES